MNVIEQYLTSLSSIAEQRNHRFGLTLKGAFDWQLAVCEIAIELYPTGSVQLGGKPFERVSRHLTYNKGQQLLGQECRLLIIDYREMLDANSLTSALGTLRGGGLAIFLLTDEVPGDYASAWLSRAFEQLLVVAQNNPLPALPSAGSITGVHSPFAQQNEAIVRIEKVLSGHRRRPLVLTADRGRGKTSALGIAAATLISTKKIRIIVTSPSVNNLTPLFDHAERLLPLAQRSKFALHLQDSSVEFIAPDELLREKPQCDLLLVDEAAAIPMSMLFALVEHYHRAVFSTTIHGYEGCGRGFTLKFQSWLRQYRPGTSFFHMDTPIRWALNDPLEQWQYTTFLLNADLCDVETLTSTDNCLRQISQQTLFESPQLLRACFALLVNAHYQTSPNDLMLILSDPAMKLFAIFDGDVCIGCIIGVEEGGLSPELIQQIQQGIRRPKGHLVATTLANHLALDVAAIVSSFRIMRIAVHPNWQRHAIGSSMLAQLETLTNYQFYSTSYGATESLVKFWLSNQFRPVKLGSQRDQASGCHSLVMVKGAVNWIVQAEQLFRSSLSYQLKDSLKDIDIALVSHLMQHCQSKVIECDALKMRLIQSYIMGGTNYENVAAFIEQYMLASGEYMSCPLIIRKVVQQWTWTECAQAFGFSGRKQTEMALRQELELLEFG